MSIGSWYVLPVFHVMPLSCDAPSIPDATPGLPGAISGFTDRVNVREADPLLLRALNWSVVRGNFVVTV